MAGIIGYARAKGGWPDGFATASDPVAAGNLWSRYEAPARALSDTRPAVARQVFALLGGSSTVAKALRHGIAHAATGGRVVKGGVAKVSEAKKLAGIRDPVLRLATDLADTGLLGLLARQMEYHSLDPAPIGGLSHAQMAQFAMQVTPDVLDNVYGQNAAGLAGALKGGIAAAGSSPYAGVFGQSTAASLSLLGALSGRHGVHGTYAGVRFAQGGPVNAYASGGVIREPVMGWGLRTGGAYSFGERGPETIVPGTAAGMNQTNFLLAQLIHETRRNTAAVQAQGTQTGRVINGTLTRAGNAGYYGG